MKKTYKILLTGLFATIVITMMMTMHNFSKENSEISNQRSEGIVQLVQNHIQKPLEQTPKGQFISQKLQDLIVQNSPYGSDWNSNIRKIAHFSLYLVLAMGLYLIFSMMNLKYLPRIGWTLLLCFIFAFFDEYTQLFQNRTASFHDVILDFSGAFTGMSFALFINMAKISINYMFDSIKQYYQNT